MLEVNQLLSAPGDTAVALGCFDGLHRGHAAVIGRAVEDKRRGLIPAVFTFTANPQQELSGSGAPRLMETADKSHILKEMGVEALYQIPFSMVMDLSPEDFVKQVLGAVLRAKRVYCGFNYHFGKGGRADHRDLRKICKTYGIEAFTLDPVMDDGSPISSTRIRNMVEAGDIESANRMLGRPLFYTLEVVKGRKLGRLLGTPTLNQLFPAGFILPRFGVYASLVRFGSTTTYGVTNIGVKPTVGSDAPLSETWMPDYNGEELYGEQVTIQLLRFLRPEKKFGDLEQLRRAIVADGETAKGIAEKNATD
ncbi:MAG: riboflavin biosynthesis protein RibF [Clostridiales bacterium]|jgi:riboflavin kinase/FMN adenylyltransferase|nr:riboflavin biosynthesis protein RibF [Clostridiales bacterium]